MSENREPRKCTKCRRPCTGHIGPTGPHCSLTPVPEWDQSFIDDDELLKDATSGPSEQATSGPSEVSVVHKKLDVLTDQFERLMSTVGRLSDKVEKSFISVSAKAVARESGGKTVGAGISSW